MDDLQDFNVDGGMAVFRPSGMVELPEAVSKVTVAISMARKQGVRRLLINASGWSGLSSPSVTERYYFVNAWAEAAGAGLRVALVARPELIDPDRFGVVVARNCGFRADVFQSENEALRWLNGPNAS